jgi:hypothetical protein
VSAQTVSKLTRDLDQAVRQFHQARLSDDYVYLFLDGVSLRVRRPAGRKQVQMLVAYGTVSSSVPPLPSFSQRDNNVGNVNTFRAHWSMHSKKSAISLSLMGCAFQPIWRLRCSM